MAGWPVAIYRGLPPAVSRVKPSVWSSVFIRGRQESGAGQYAKSNNDTEEVLISALCAMGDGGLEGKYWPRLA